MEAISLHPLPPSSSSSFRTLRNYPYPQLTLPTSHSSLIDASFRFRLFAIRSPRFDFNGLNFDHNGDDGDFDRRRRPTRKRRSDRWWRRRQWWSDEEEYDSPKQPRPGGTLQQVIDNLWIFKVLTSYGWFAPVIMLSLLLTTGPKAFLMAFSIPLGLSLLILAFQKLSEWLDNSPKRRRRRKSKYPLSRKSDVFMEKEDDGTEEEILQKRRNMKGGYRSSVAGSRRPKASRFGGWDEFVSDEETERAMSSSEMGMPEVAAKSNRSLEERNPPLLLRLLVALFPFLGSWTNLL